MLLLDRRSAPFLAVGAALVVLAGGLVAVGVWSATTASVAGWVARWPRTCPRRPPARTGRSPSALQAFDVGTGEPRWTRPAISQATPTP